MKWGFLLIYWSTLHIDSDRHNEKNSLVFSNYRTEHDGSKTLMITEQHKKGIMSYSS